MVHIVQYVGVVCVCYVFGNRQHTHSESLREAVTGINYQSVGTSGFRPSSCHLQNTPISMPCTHLIFFWSTNTHTSLSQCTCLQRHSQINVSATLFPWVLYHKNVQESRRKLGATSQLPLLSSRDLWAELRCSGESCKNNCWNGNFDAPKLLSSNRNLLLLCWLLLVHLTFPWGAELGFVQGPSKAIVTKRTKVQHLPAGLVIC